MTADANIYDRVVGGYRKWRADISPGLRETRHSFHLLLKNPLAVTGLTIFVLLILVAIFAPQIAPPLENPLALRHHARMSIFLVRHGEAVLITSGQQADGGHIVVAKNSGRAGGS